MSRRSTRITRKLKIGNVTLIEKGIYVGGELEDTHCYAQFSDGHKVGGYISIEDAIHHKGEWSDD